MALVLNDEQVMLKDAARDFLVAQAPVSHLRELRDTNNSDGVSRTVWRNIVDMGWSAMLVPEQYDGLGYGFTGMGLVLEECGRTLTPSPLHSSALIGAAALLRGGSDEQRAAIFPEIASGDHLLALAVDDGPHHCPENCDMRAEQSSTSYKLSGSKTAVLDGQIANTFIVSAKLGSSRQIGLFLVPANATGVNIDAMAVLDTHKAARVTLDDVELPLTALLGDLQNGTDLLDYVLDIGRIGQAAELLGIAQEIFERTVEYLKTRKQFGVPVGSFQALQHRAAKLYGEIELSKSATLNALHALDEDADNIAVIASMTKAKLCETAHTAAIEGVQMHGGMGMTDECEVGFFLKRCQILETIYGDRYYHLDRFARLKGY